MRPNLLPRMRSTKRGQTEAIRNRRGIRIRSAEERPQRVSRSQGAHRGQSDGQRRQALPTPPAVPPTVSSGPNIAAVAAPIANQDVEQLLEPQFVVRVEERGRSHGRDGRRKRQEFRAETLQRVSTIKLANAYNV